MGGTSYFTFRKVRVCECMLEPLEELVRLTGSAFKVSPIPNFGSYQDGTTDSGSTATGGGHIDIYLTGYSTKVKKQVETYARMIGFYADIREKRWWSDWYGRWITKTWANHMHMLLKDCPHLSAGARAQIREWQVEGENGLAGNDLDDGDRTYVWQTWDQYVAKRDGGIVVVSPVERFIVRKGDTLGKIAAAVGISLAALLALNPSIDNPDAIREGQTITVPKPGTVAGAPKPAVPSKPSTSKPAAPKPVTLSPVVLTKWSAKYLHAGARNRTVVSYEKALAAYLGTAKARALGLTGSIVTDGYYGTATSAGTKAAYRKLGVTPNATEPGPTLLRVLAGGTKASSNPAPATSVSRSGERVDLTKLRPGVSSRHVTAYQRALRAYLGSSANRYNPAGATGFYGSQTEAMTRAVYRDLAKKQPRGGWTPSSGIPGPGLLRLLGLG